MTLLTLPASGLPAGDASTPGEGRLRQAALAVGVVLLIAAAGALAGTSQYAAQRQALITEAEQGARRFHAVFRDASEARLRAMSLGVELAAHSEPIAEALRRQDRAELGRLTTSFYDQVLKPRYAITVLDFQSADGAMVYRAHRPAQFGDDASGRAMVAAAQKERSTVAGIEIGKSGPELRAMAPVLAGGVLVGSLELGSSVADALRAGAEASGLDYAFALDARIAQTTDRPRGAGDVTINGALYDQFSRPEVGDLLRSLPPAAVGEGSSQLVRAGGRDLFVDTVALDDVGHQPTTRVTLVRDLTPALRAARNGVGLLSLIGAGALIAAVLAGLGQFRALRQRLERGFAGRSGEMRAKARAYDEMVQATQDLQAWKVGILNEVVLVVRDPLVAVAAALKAAEGRAGFGDGQEDRLAERHGDRHGERHVDRHGERQAERAASLAFAVGEVDRLNRALDDQIGMVSLRDELRRVECLPVDLLRLVDELTEGAGASGGPGGLRRAAPDDLPDVSGDPRMLSSALRTLLHWLRRWSEMGTLTFEARAEGSRVVGRLTMPGAWTSEPPSLDEASALSSFTGTAGGNALVLARLTFEQFGGGLAFEQGANLVGFSFALRVA